jgi:transcriptional regulator with AAA-type ATPase domain
MKALPESLKPFQPFLENAPFAVWAIDKNDYSVTWTNHDNFNHNYFYFEKIIGLKASDLLKPFNEYRASDIETLITERSGKPFKAYINQGHEAVKLFSKSYSLTGARCTVHVVELSDCFVLFIQPNPGPLAKEYMATTRDFFVLLDDQNRIREISESFFLYSTFRGRSFFHKDITEFIHAADWEAIQQARQEALDYCREYGKAAGKPWKTILKDGFRDLKLWNKSEGETWSIKPGQGLACLNGNSMEYLYVSKCLDIAKKDFSVSLSVVQAEGSRFGLLLNQKDPTEWDTGGYNLGILVKGKNLLLALKKSSRFLLYARLARSRDKLYTLKAEKRGGLLTVYMNGEKAFEYIDITPISNQNGAFGIYSDGCNTFTNFEVAVRDGRFDESRTFSPRRLNLPGLADRVFQAGFLPIEIWGRDDFPVIREALLFQDVTDIAAVEKDRDRLSRRNAYLKTKNYYGFVGGNRRITELLEKIEGVAQSSASILITGPTGSGKAVLARAVHMRSTRNKGPFVKVDCATIPQNLLESELFGHEKGAFTGAVERRIGKFEAADGGTLFLDEIGNLDLTTQAKLLGFLEDHIFTRVGSHEPLKVDVRIIAATNAPLKDMVEAGLFREDLFYRLMVICADLPPLSERMDDIPLLVDHFLNEINARHRLSIQGVEKPVLEALLRHAWPGNVRELYNVLVNLAVARKKGPLRQAPSFSGLPRARSGRRTYIPETVRRETLLKHAAKAKYFSARDCLNLLPVSLPTIQRDLNRLVRSGKLRIQGKGPAARYVFSKKKKR